MNEKQIKMLTADQHMLLVEAMQKIDANSNGILFVTDEKDKLCGVVSDGDIRRWIIRTGRLDAELHLLMNPSPKYIYAGEMKNPYSYMAEMVIRALPVLDEDRHIQSIVLLQDKHRQSMQQNDSLKEVSVIIMAGGEGTRLYPYTKVLPKPLIPIGDIPIMERIIDCFFNYGIKDYYITVNYRKNMIRSYFSEIERPYHIQYVEEERSLGTAGSLCLIQKSFQMPVFLTNCDILIRGDYEDIYNYHKRSGNSITMVTALKNDIIPYGVVYAKENGEVCQIKEKPRRSYFVNTGMYVMNPEIIEMIPKDTFFHMTDLMDRVMHSGLKVGMYPVSEDSFLDMGEFEEMKRMEEKLDLKQ